MMGMMIMMMMTPEPVPLTGVPCRLKLSSSAKEAVKVAVDAGARRLQEAAQEFRSTRKQSKVRVRVRG